jgi:hypothetical protein
MGLVRAATRGAFPCGRPDGVSSRFMPVDLHTGLSGTINVSLS